MTHGVVAVDKNQSAYTDRIIQDPEIMVGKPVVRGTRIPVEKVLDQLAYKPDFAEVLAIWPGLTIEDVQACLAYAGKLVARKRPLRVPKVGIDVQPARVWGS
jgi:uncharacterized protein (DUF433 family)